MVTPRIWFARATPFILPLALLSAWTDATPAQDLPPGHSPMQQPEEAPPAASPGTANSARAMPPGHPPTATGPEGAMPPGHPPTGSPPTPSPPTPSSPTPTSADVQRNSMGPLPDRSIADPTVPAGAVLVEIRDEQGDPLPGIEVGLVTLFSSISEGNSEATKKAVTDQNGEAAFQGLDESLRYSYGVEVKRDGATYSMEPFRLNKVGQRVVMHTYPVSSDLQEAFVGIQVLKSVTLSSGHFSIQSVYRVMPLSRKTFVPDDLSWPVPQDAKAFDTSQVMGDGRLEVEAGKVHLKGSFPPGRNQVAYTYQIDHDNAESQVIDFGLPPHVTNFVIVIEETPGMTVSLPGFDIMETENQEGNKVFVARRTMQPGEAPLKHLPLELRGLPTVGPGRWYASGIALMIGIGGLGLSLSRRNKRDNEEQRDRKRARQVLLDEMVLLQRAFESEEIGPRTYEQTKREILIALSRLDQNVQA